MNGSDKQTIFLLSPANLGGVRARQMCSKRAGFPVALAYRDGGVPIGDAFAFMSALYFRGKITYARRFGSEVDGSPGAFVITPGYGLVTPDWKIDEERMRRLRRTRIDTRSRSYRKPLESDLRELTARCSPEVRFVLLGSVATGKYVDVLHPILGDRLMFPAIFAGMGDMQRGSVMLKAARAGEELQYVGLGKWKVTNEE